MVVACSRCCSCSSNPSLRFRPASALLVVLLVVQQALAASSAGQPTQCAVSIQGAPAGGISSASLACRDGPPARIALHPLLERFAGGFQGVARDSSCGNPGCLLAVCADTRLVILNSIITGVRGPAGLTAVICVAGGAALTLQDSTISDNRASAIAASGAASVVVAASKLVGNLVGVRVLNASDDVTLIELDGRIISSHAALNGSGGAIAAADAARVVITNGSVLQGNECVNRVCVGGAVALCGTASLTVDRGSRVVENRAELAGGGIAAFEGSRVRVAGGSLVCGNAALNGSGGGVFLTGDAQLVVTERSKVCNNTCPIGSGGGVQAQGGASVSIHKGSTVFGNKASTSKANGRPGGGLLMSNRSSLLIDGGSGVWGNSAGVAGGGVALLNYTSAVITGGSFISNNTCEADQPLSFGRGGAGLLVYGNASLVLTGGSRVTGNRAIATSGGGVFLAGNSSAVFSDGVLFEGNEVDPGFGGSNIATFSHSTFSLDPGVMHRDNPLTKCSKSVFLGRVPCGVGERGTSGICSCCPAYTFDFEGGETPCRECPDRAWCPGGSEVLPEEGFWHSSPRSLQIHACPIHPSCRENGMCSEGHMGSLCGQCVVEEGWGITLPLQCRRCLPPARQLGSHVAIVFVTVLFVAITVRYTWQDNKENDNSLHVSDLLKVVVQWLQYLVIVAATSGVPWPRFMVAAYSLATVVFGAASGHALSLDCLLQHYGAGKDALPIAIQRQLVFFTAPIGNYFFVALLLVVGHFAKRAWQACSRRGAGAAAMSLKQFDPTKLLVAIPVVLFFAYPTLCKASLSFFACLRIDDANLQPYAEYAVLNHTAGYWAGAIEQECFVGWHRAWALGLGLPTVLLFCVGVPLGMFVFLYANRARLSDPAYRKYFGFIYRNFKEDKVWWEAVWALQTVMLVAVSVFHFGLRAYNALLLLGLLLLGSAVLQVVAKPYVHHRLHRLHLASTVCLILNVWCALAFFSCTGLANTACMSGYHTAVGVVMVAVDVLFLVWCLYEIFVVSVPVLQAWGETTTGLVQAASVKLQGQRRKRRMSRGGPDLPDSLSGLWDQVARRHRGPHGPPVEHEQPVSFELSPVMSAPARFA